MIVPKADVKNMGEKFFVTKIPQTVTQQFLKTHFEQTIGPLFECKLIWADPRNPVQHKGFGFIRFMKKEDSEKFRKQIHTFEGQQIVVKQFKDNNTSERVVTRPDGTMKFFLSPTDENIHTKQALQKFFCDYGVVTDVFVKRGGTFAFITIKDEGGLEPLKMGGKFMVCGQEVDVKIARPRKNPSRFDARPFSGGYQQPPQQPAQQWNTFTPSYGQQSMPQFAAPGQQFAQVPVQQFAPVQQFVQAPGQQFAQAGQQFMPMQQQPGAVPMQQGMQMQPGSMQMQPGSMQMQPQPPGLMPGQQMVMQQPHAQAPGAYGMQRPGTSHAKAFQPYQAASHHAIPQQQGRGQRRR